MPFFRLKRQRNLEHRSTLYPAYIAGGVILALAVALVVMCVLHARANGRLSTQREFLIGQVQSELNQVVRAFSQVDLPTADISGSIVPTLRQHVYAADLIDEALEDGFGTEAALFDHALYQNITLCLDELATDIKTGQSTAGSVDALREYIVQLESMLTARFASVNMLMP